MKINTVTREVESAGTLHTSEFKISANAKTFRMLTTSIYSDRALAVLRELSSNAYDAHIDVGTPDRPFEWTIPTTFAPTFGIRDYGPGMSYNDCVNLYTTFGESTKDDSNSQVGAFGLGSKAFFAYTDSATIISRHNGEKHTFAAFIGDEGIPQITHFASEPTDEATGLEVTFPVKTKDVRDFERSAIQVAKGFDIKPVVTNNDTFPFEYDDIQLEGEGWKLLNVTGYGHNKRAVAQQGCVRYKLDVDSLPTLTGVARDLVHSPLVIDFPIGQLDVAVSREGLGYDETTIQNVINRLEEVKNDIAEKYKNEVASAATLWETRLVYAALGSNYSLPDVVRKLLKNAVKWRGKPVTNRIALEMRKFSGCELCMMATTSRNTPRQASAD